MTARILTRSAGWRSGVALALVVSIGGATLVAGGDAAQATETTTGAVSDAALLAATSGAAPTLRVVNGRTLEVTMSKELYQSSQRVRVTVDGHYVGETYKGNGYYLSARVSGDDVILTRTLAAAPTTTLEATLDSGYPGGPFDAKTARVIAHVFLDAPTLRVVNGRTLEVTMSKKLFESAQRVRVTVDGRYVGETYKGNGYYLSARVSGDDVILSRTLPYAPDKTLEATIISGTPGSGFDAKPAQVIAHVELAGAGPDLRIRQASSTVTVIPRGDAEADAKRENRWFRHSVLEPVGRYVTAGQKLTVQPAAGETGLSIAIGQYGPHTGINGGADKALSYIPVTGSRAVTITAPIDGLVYAVNASDATAQITVSGGTPVPTFVLGETSVDDFSTQLAAFPSSPLTVIEGKRVAAAFQRRFLEPRLASFSSDRVQSWDDVVARTDRVSGLSVADVGVNRKSLARIYMGNADTGAGAAYAWYDYVMFQVNGGVASDLLTHSFDHQWGLWHEIGHTYQTPQYRWSGMTEVTVNISSIAVQEGLGRPYDWQANTNTKKAYDAFFAQPEAERDFNTASGIQLVMFDQLYQKYGVDFYATLNRLYRERANDGTLHVSGTVAMQQYFMVTAGEASGHNLTSFFAGWGLKPDAATKAALAKYPN